MIIKWILSILFAIIIIGYVLLFIHIFQTIFQDDSNMRDNMNIIKNKYSNIFNWNNIRDIFFNYQDNNKNIVIENNNNNIISEFKIFSDIFTFDETGMYSEKYKFTFKKSETDNNLYSSYVNNTKKIEIYGLTSVYYNTLLCNMNIPVPLYLHISKEEIDIKNNKYYNNLVTYWKVCTSKNNLPKITLFNDDRNYNLLPSDNILKKDIKHKFKNGDKYRLTLTIPTYSFFSNYLNFINSTTSKI